MLRTPRHWMPMRSSRFQSALPWQQQDVWTTKASSCMPPRHPTVASTRFTTPGFLRRFVDETRRSNLRDSMGWDRTHLRVYFGSASFGIGRGSSNQTRSRTTSTTKIYDVKIANGGRPHLTAEARDAHKDQSRRMARGVKRNFPSGDVPDGEEQVRDDRKAYVDENKRGNETDDGRMLQICVGVKRLQTSDKEFVAQSQLQAAREAQLSALETARLEQLKYLRGEKAKRKEEDMGMQTGKRAECHAEDPYADINEALRQAHWEHLHRTRKKDS